MEFAKAVATQLPQVTVDHELVFQFYRVCSEVHNCTLSATPKLLQHHGAAAPCYQVMIARCVCVCVCVVQPFFSAVIDCVAHSA